MAEELLAAFWGKRSDRMISLMIIPTKTLGILHYFVQVGKSKQPYGRVLKTLFRPFENAGWGASICQSPRGLLNYLGIRQTKGWRAAISTRTIPGIVPIVVQIEHPVRWVPDSNLIAVIFIPITGYGDVIGQAKGW